MEEVSMELSTSWTPNESEIKSTNIFRLMQKLKIGSYPEFFRWSVDAREDFWGMVIEELKIVFRAPYKHVVDLSKGVESPRWLPGASMNIVESCFKNDPKDIAVIYKQEEGEIKPLSYGELNAFVNRVSNGLVALGYKKGDAIAIDMPMNVESVAIYLGIIKAGLVVVSIADSFAADEIATRLKISKAKGIFTQDFILRGGKKIPLYKKIAEARAPRAIVLSARSPDSSPLRVGDIFWDDFLSKDEFFKAVSCDPSDHTNILFSSGTTGIPKAIPWNHTTPIKSAADGFLHHDVKQGDVVAWPTNLGWMMGPWLIYATLINRGTIALYDGLPTTREFGEFVEKERVTMLGLVPSIVKYWRETGCMEGLDWSAIQCFSSTGESSNPDDYRYLMSLNNRPVIEYCGGTEIGGGYITGTLVQSAYASTFSTPALGLDFVILDEDGKESDVGELFLVPPSIGLSNELLNGDNYKVYYEGVPRGPNGEVLRRHGDQMERFANGYYRALGRADDTMNLGGIKISSVEIERVVNKAGGVKESAAVAINPKGGGPSLLIIYAVINNGQRVNEKELKETMQQLIRKELNPLFKIEDVVIIDSLPRTASNKVMRRLLRGRYQAK